MTTVQNLQAIITALANEKGGVGKTTLTAIFIAMLARLGYRVLGIDLDPQGHLGLLYGYHRITIGESVYSILLKYKPDVLSGPRAPMKRVLKKTLVDSSGRIFDPRQPTGDGLDIVLRKVSSQEQIETIVRAVAPDLLDNAAAGPFPASTIWYSIQQKITAALHYCDEQAFEADETETYINDLIVKETTGRYTAETWQQAQERIDAEVWTLLQQRIAESTPGPDLLPINAGAGEADTDLKKAHEYWGGQLRHALHRLQSDYDYIFIDCPPSIQSLTINALNAAQFVCIPLTPETLDLEGMVGLLDVIEQAQRQTNPDLKLAGIILNKVQSTWKLHQDGARDLRSWEGAVRVFNTEIKRNSPVVTSISNQSLIVLDQQESDYARAYWLLLEELLAVIGGPAQEVVSQIADTIRKEAQIRKEKKQAKQQVKKIEEVTASRKRA
ncbi:ParA family protein [Reticulibacter mediterranei]|nr:ParA family protein [Reticulibacter mediterranei]